MDADEIERIIDDELKKMDLSEEDWDDYKEEEELILQLSEDDGNSETDTIPESVQTYFEAARDRLNVLEKLLQEDQEEKNDTSQNGTSVVTCEDLLNHLVVSAGDSPVALKERIISVVEEQFAHPTALGHQMAVEDSALLQNIPAVGESDEYVEVEQRLELELEELEKRLKLEEEKKREAHEAQHRQHLLREEQEEKRNRLRQQQFAEELKKIDEECQFQNAMAAEPEEFIKEKIELELANQKELIRRLEEAVDAERQAFVEAQEEQRRRQVEKEQRAATLIQAAIRSFLTRRWIKPALNRRREEERRKVEQRKMEKERKEREERLRLQREEEEKRREKEEARQREEQERRRAAYEKAKQEERQRLEHERRLVEENKRKEEEERKRREEEEGERKRQEAEERKRQEKEEQERTQKMEKERQRKLEEKTRKDEEARQRQEEQWKRKEEEEKRREAEEQRKRREEEEEEKKRIEGERKKKLKEEMKRKEEKKLEEEREVKAKEEKRSESVEGSRSLQKQSGEESERRNTQSLPKTAPQETDITHAETVEQRTAASTDDQAITTQHISCSTPEPTHVHQRGTPGQPLGQTSTAGSTKPLGQSDCADGAVDAGSVCLPDRTEQKRLAWMLHCIPWSKLSVQNRRRAPLGQQAKRRGPRRPTQLSLTPLSVETVLQSGACTSLSQVTTVTLEDLPGCSLSTLSACGQLHFLKLQRCGLTALEGLSSCTQLRHIDVQENSITYVDCRDLARLQVLRLGRNQLTSIHGLDGATDLLELQLSHNRISRLGGLETLKKLQSLWMDHNQLTSMRGLTEQFTLQHLDLSHNHVTRVEGLDNCALLCTLRLAGNTLMEAPSLRNHVLLGELSLEDNSISCLVALASCWLPLLHSLNVAQNSLTQLPPLPDFISLNTLDVSHNCLSELQSVCESVQQCSHLQQLRLYGNPLQQESSWRSSLLAAVPGLLLVDGEETGACLPCPNCVPVAGSFQALCQAQQQQLLSLQATQLAEISSATSLLEAQLLFGCHSEALFKLAEEQRYAHEYGDTSITRQSVSVSSPEGASYPAARSPNGAAGEAEPATKPSIQIPSPPHQSLDRQSADSHQPDQTSASCGPAQARPMQRASRSLPQCSPGPRHAKLDLRSVAAVVIQKYWRGYQCRLRKCPPKCQEAHGKCSPLVMSKIGMALPVSADRDYAATVIQAAWRGHALRSRLHRTLAAVAAEEEHAGPGDEGLEEVDVDQFVFDEKVFERDWSVPGSVGVSLPCPEVAMAAFSEQTPLPKATHPAAVHHKRNPPVLLWKPKQAWGGSKASEVAIHHGSPSSKSPASKSSGVGLSARSEKILEEWGITDSHTAFLMLKRAQRMKSKKHQQRKLQDPTVRLAMFRNHGAQQPLSTPLHGSALSEQWRDGCQAPFTTEKEEEEEVEEEKEEEQWEKGGRRQAGRTYQWMHTQAVGLASSSHSNSHTHSTCASERFLPEINPDVLSGGRVQLVTVPGYRDGICDGPADFSHRETGIVRRHSVGHTRKEAPAPQRVTSAPTKKERISFRDKPVQLSGGWGGGKKRVRVCK